MPVRESATYPLRYREGHLFIELNGGLWIFDTGSPTSFGNGETISFGGRDFRISRDYFGLTAEKLTGFVGVPVAGLLGADVFGSFDMIIDVEGEQLRVAEEGLTHPGTVIKLDFFMGIPVMEVEISGERHRMFFDTGAQVSYFQGDGLADFPSLGIVRDFYPGIGEFETETHEVPVSVGGRVFRLRSGRLSGMLGMTLEMAGVNGIIGNAVLEEGAAGYFPRRRELVL